MHTAVQPETDCNASTSGIGWPPPYDDSMKLNCDGRLQITEPKLAAEGLFATVKANTFLDFQ